jgi:phage terminase Nu1 subunit (DNA packaging protein)
MQNLSISALADLVGMTRETVNKRLSAAGLVGTTGAHNSSLFESAQALAAIYEVKINDQTAVMVARAENLIADTKLKALKEQQILGELAPIAALEWALTSVCAQISAVLETLPAKLKRRLPQLTSADLHLVQTEIAKARNAAASATLNFGSADQ